MYSIFKSQGLLLNQYKMNEIYSSHKLLDFERSKVEFKLRRRRREASLASKFVCVEWKFRFNGINEKKCMDLSDDELPHMYLKHVTSLKQRIHQTMEQGAQTVLTESVCVSTNACLGLYLTSTTDSLTTRRRRGALTTRSLSVLNENASSYGTRS